MDLAIIELKPDALSAIVLGGDDATHAFQFTGKKAKEAKETM